MKYQVHTSLLGRWAKGTYWYRNPKYVAPAGSFLEYTRKQNKELSEDQKTYWAYNRVHGQIIAVSAEGQGEYQTLRLWILIDGKPCFLDDNAVVMPEGWTPEVPR